MPKIRAERRGAGGGAGGGSAPFGDSSQSKGASSSHSTVRTLLAPNTSIGQHFLKNPAVVDSIVAKAQVRD